MDWTKYFDHIYCFHFIKDSSRLEGIKQEFKRVGILDSGIFSFVYTSPDPWEQRMWDAVPRCHTGFGIKFLNLGLATARTFREALGLGYKRCLILEDDIRFLKDIDKIERIIAATPNECGIVQYDKFLPWDMTLREYKKMVEAHKYNEHFFCSYGRPLYSGACYFVSTQGMTALLDYLENKNPQPPDGIFKLVNVKTGTAIQNVAIQVCFKDAMCQEYFKGEGNTHHKAYAPMELDYSLYNVPNGYGYQSLTATV